MVEQYKQKTHRKPCKSQIKVFAYPRSWDQGCWGTSLYGFCRYVDMCVALKGRVFSRFGHK